MFEKNGQLSGQRREEREVALKGRGERISRRKELAVISNILVK